MPVLVSGDKGISKSDNDFLAESPTQNT